MIILELLGRLIELIVLRLFGSRPFRWVWFMWMTRDNETRENFGILLIAGVALVLLMIGLI